MLVTVGQTRMRFESHCRFTVCIRGSPHRRSTFLVCGAYACHGVSVFVVGVGGGGSV